MHHNLSAFFIPNLIIQGFCGRKHAHVEKENWHYYTMYHSTVYSLGVAFPWNATERGPHFYFYFFTSFEHEKRDVKQRISATLWISWAESSHRTRRKRGKGWIINHPRAMWRTAWSPLKKWILQYTIDLSKPASHAIYTRKVLREERPASPVLSFILPSLVLFTTEYCYHWNHHYS